MKMTITTSKTMLSKCVVFIILISVVFSLPVTKTKYDESQQGKLNVRAEFDNILILFIPSGGVRLLDTEQIGSLVSLVAGSRNNPITTTGNKEPPYKVDVDQSAIDKLHSDIDTLNSIIPISKNYNNDVKNIDNAEKKEIVDEPLEIVTKIDEKTNSDDRKDEITSPEPVPTTVSTTSDQPVTSEEAKLSTSASPEITTSESIITSVPLVKTSSDKVKPTKVVQTPDTTIIQTKSPVEDLSTKLNQRVIESSAPIKPQVKSSSPTSSSSPQRPKTTSTSSTSSTSKAVKPLNNGEDQQRERQLKALQAGLIHCSPGQSLVNGDCVEVEPSRESRHEKMERLLTLLRFGIQPANSN